MTQYLTRPDGSIPHGVDVAGLQAAGIRIVRPVLPPRASGMIAIEGEPEDRDGAWWQTWRLEPAPPPEVDPAEIRAQRDELLAACDWTQLSDAPLGDEARAAWSAYRAALRDVPQQPGFPNSVTWPDAPG